MCLKYHNLFSYLCSFNTITSLKNTFFRDFYTMKQNVKNFLKFQEKKIFINKLIFPKQKCIFLKIKLFAVLLSYV